MTEAVGWIRESADILILIFVFWCAFCVFWCAFYLERLNRQVKLIQDVLIVEEARRQERVDRQVQAMQDVLDVEGARRSRNLDDQD